MTTTGESVFTAESSTTANPQLVWAALSDLTGWPNWCETYVSIRRLDDGPLRVGSRARVKQHGLAPGIWEVTELDEGRSFTWATKAPGVRTVASHELVHLPDGGTRIRLEVRQRGPLAAVVRLLLGAKVRRYVALEAEGLKSAAEASRAEPE